MTDAAPKRAVLDTNVIIAALLSRNLNSPLRELLTRWHNGEFELLYCLDLLAEYREKLVSKRIMPSTTLNFLRELAAAGVAVDLFPGDILPRVVQDPDDDIVVACALVGGATHLVTYDPHIHSLGSSIEGVQILDGLHFLYAVRGDVPPE